MFAVDDKNLACQESHPDEGICCDNRNYNIALEAHHGNGNANAMMLGSLSDSFLVTGLS